MIALVSCVNSFGKGDIYFQIPYIFPMHSFFLCYQCWLQGSGGAVVRRPVPYLVKVNSSQFENHAAFPDLSCSYSSCCYDFIVWMFIL